MNLKERERKRQRMAVGAEGRHITCPVS